MQTPNYYAIIPADVRYDKRLSMLERLLYGEITALSQKTGECWATNAYFAELYEKQPNSISHNISNLAKYGYIATNIDKDGGNKRVISIKVNTNSYHDKSQYPVTTNTDSPITINHKLNNTSINNTSSIKESKKDNPVQIAPPSKQDDEDFNLFITAYPGQGRFITALETWHTKRTKGRLPSIDKILEAVEEQKLYRFTDPQGKYILNPARWLEEEEWRYLIDPAVKASLTIKNKERREDELREMFIKGSSSDELGAFARKHKIRPDLYPPLTQEVAKHGQN